MAEFLPGIFLTAVLVGVAITYAKIKRFGKEEKATWNKRMVVTPFIVLMSLVLNVIVVWPELSLWLPEHMTS